MVSTLKRLLAALLFCSCLFALMPAHANDAPELDKADNSDPVISINETDPEGHSGADVADEPAEHKQQGTAAIEEDEEEDKDKVKDKDDEKKEEAPQPFYNKDWLVDGQFEGELEFRYSEERFQDGTEGFARDYGAYLGYRVEPWRDWEFQLGLKTGRSERPTTSWIDAADLNDARLLWFREYWVRHEVEPVKDDLLRVQAGRFNYPFDATQLVFDSDMYMPGAYAEYRWNIKDSDLERVDLAMYMAELRDRKPGDAGSAGLTTARLATAWETDKQTEIKAAVSGHWFSNVDTIGAAILSEGWRVGGSPGGETTNYWDGAGDLESEFRLLDLYFEGEWHKDSAWPVGIELEWVRNLAAQGRGEREDIAWFAGLKVGPSGDPGDLQFGIEQVRVETDSVLAASNRGEYSSNYKGTQLEVSFTPVEHVEWTLAYSWKNSIADQGNGLVFDDEELRFYVTLEW